MSEIKNIKKAVLDKLIFLSISLLLFSFVYFKLDYEFNNMILNSILLFGLSYIFRFVFTFDSLDLFLDSGSQNFKPDAEEYKAEELKLRFKYPKLYTYNQIVLYMFIVIKVIAVLLFVYSGTQLMILDNQP